MEDKTPTQYVLGFMFNIALDMVVLIQKEKPAWQKGKLNGTGGHIERYDIDPLDAMIREHRQETMVTTLRKDWKHFGNMGDGQTFGVDLFAVATESAFDARTTTNEKVDIYAVQNLSAPNSIENLPWLIHLAIDTLRDGRPDFVTIQYPGNGK